MNAKNLNGKPGARANLSRTGFDMSQEFAFTSSVGMCLPTYQDFLNVGESVHFSGDMIIRTQPLVTASMCDIDIYLDWFFVPASMLFTLWPSKRWQTNDFVSDFYDVSEMSDNFPIFDIEFHLSNSDYAYSNTADSQYSNSPWGSDFECLGKSKFRLANHLGFNPYGIFKGDGTVKTEYASQDNPNVFPLFALAYQCIWQDYFRLPVDDYVRRRMTFNVDSYGVGSYTAIQTLTKSLFQLNYRPRNMDYFTSVKASPLFSSVNSFDSNFGEVSSLLTQVNNYLDVNNPITSDSDGSGDSSQYGVTQLVSSNSDVLSTGNIRNIFAVEKLLRVTGRAKKDYDSQVLAHFGFKVPHDVKHELTHIKQQHAILHIGEVISTSDTYSEGSGSSLGAIGGKGYGVISAPKKPWSFTAPVDGVFMCVFSSAPRQRYFGTFDKQNVLTDRLSFYQPEFDKLGMQPLWAYEAFGFHPDFSDERFGWQYRYEQWKRKYNRVSEAFAAPDIYSGNVNQNVSWVNGTRPYGTAFSTPTTPSSIGFNGRGLFVTPKDLNQIMVVPYTPEWSDNYKQNAPAMFYTDPFINAFRANVKKVSTMSSFGEPDLNGI